MTVMLLSSLSSGYNEDGGYMTVLWMDKYSDRVTPSRNVGTLNLIIALASFQYLQTSVKPRDDWIMWKVLQFQTKN